MLNTILMITLTVVIVLLLILQTADAIKTGNVRKLEDIVYALVLKAEEDLPDATGNEKFKQVVEWLKKVFPKEYTVESVQSINALIEQAVDWMNKTK